MNGIYRAERKDGKGTVTGYYVVIDNTHYIIEPDRNGGFRKADGVGIVIQAAHEVEKSSIAADTGRTDKHDEPIFGCIEIDGVMSSGGDEVKITFVPLMASKDSLYYNIEKVVISTQRGVGLQRLKEGLSFPDLTPEQIEKKFLQPYEREEIRSTIWNSIWRSEEKAEIIKPERNKQ